MNASHGLTSSPLLRFIDFVESRNDLASIVDVVYVISIDICCQERPYHSDSTASRLLSEVKHCRASPPLHSIYALPFARIHWWLLPGGYCLRMHAIL
eukprot:scaffold1742_cov150-Skeletonema_marinoi.AAC.4